MVKEIEGFNTQLEFFTFGYFSDLGQRHVPIVEARSVKKSTPRIAQLPLRTTQRYFSTQDVLLLLSRTAQ
jgi:hypothetical protein